MTAAEMRGHAGRVNALAVDRCGCGLYYSARRCVLWRAACVTRAVRHAFTLYSGGRDKAVHEWQGATWQAGMGDGLVFAGNVLQPSCGDVVLALAAHSECSGSLVAGSKNGTLQTWRAGKADGSTSIAHGQINAVQV